MGVDAFKAQKSPLDVVEIMVWELENNPHFNAGRGSFLTSNGTEKLEACLMDGNTKKCETISGLTIIVNVISLDRLVMEKTPHIYLAFEGAEEFGYLMDISDKSWMNLLRSIDEYGRRVNVFLDKAFGRGENSNDISMKMLEEEDDLDDTNWDWMEADD